MPALAISAALLGMGASLVTVQHVPSSAQASQYSPLTTTSAADN